MSTHTAPAILGVGETEYVRGTDRLEEQFAIQAALAACDDAGIDPSDVDGIVLPGFRGRVEDLVNALGVRDLRWSGRIEMGGASSVAALEQASVAVASGRARYVIAGTARLGYSSRRVGAGGEELLREHSRFFPSPQLRWNLEYPNGVLVPIHYYGLQATRWLELYEIDRRALAEVALTMRRHSHTNARAYMKGRELTEHDYAVSPFICEPLRMLDCCLETDAGAAVLVGANNDVADPTRAIRILAAAEGHPESPDDIVSRPDMLEMGIGRAATRAFEEAGVGPADFDFAQLYDCFTFVVLRQLEEMGFCSRGESPKFVFEQGIGRDERLPVNTHGGMLSQAHVTGMNHVVEAVRQLRGEAGPGQLCRSVRLGVVTGYGDMGDGSVAILTNTGGPS